MWRTRVFKQVWAAISFRGGTNIEELFRACWGAEATARVDGGPAQLLMERRARGEEADRGGLQIWPAAPCTPGISQKKKT